jgi:hypothetical protein
VYEIVGSATLFLFLSFVFITYFGIRYNIPSKIVIVLMVLFSLLTLFYAPDLGLIITALITVLGIIVYKAIAMFLQRDR